MPEILKFLFRLDELLLITWMFFLAYSTVDYTLWWLYFCWGHSLIVRLCSNSNLDVVLRLVRSTFTDSFIMFCSACSLMYVNLIWSWYLHVLHDWQLIHLYLTVLPISSAWLNTFWHFTSKALSAFSHCSLLKFHISYCCLASL